MSKEKTSFVDGKVFKNFMSKLYGFGAAVVILGALFKINHYPGANFMLIAGMGTEAIIFFFSAFERPHVEPDWSLVYPELIGQYHGAGYVPDEVTIPTSRGSRGTQVASPSASAELDKLLQNANIDTGVLKNLGEGFKNLNNTVSSLSDITSIGTAGKGLSESLKTAGQKTDGLSENIAMLNAAYENQINKTNSQFETLANRMSQVFELQMKKSQEQNSANEAIQKSMDKFVESMQAAAKYNEQYQKESAQLAKNIAELNQVYANMLSAFIYNKK